MRQLARTSIALCSLALIASARSLSAQAKQATAPSLSAPMLASLDSLITRSMDDAGIMGFGAAVIVDKRVVWMKGYGFTDWQRTRPFTRNTTAKVASVAKPFVGVSMMRAVKEGKLSLDADINQYLPFRVVNPHRPNERITLRHLATHTSGITDRWEIYRATYRFDGNSKESLHAFLQAYFTPGGKYYAKENFLEAKPGELRDYSNIGAALAGLIVERAHGQALNVYTKRHIFTPLGMNNTGWFLREVNAANHSSPFVSQGGFSIPIAIYEGTTYPDGGLRTSVSDLSRFFIAMLNDGVLDGVRILDSASTAEMRRFQLTDANRPTNFPAADGNTGLFWRTKFNGLRVGHGGNDPGVEVEMLSDVAGNVGVIYISNTSLSGTDRRATGAIFDALWKYGEHLRATGTPGSR